MSLETTFVSNVKNNNKHLQMFFDFLELLGLTIYGWSILYLILLLENIPPQLQASISLNKINLWYDYLHNNTSF